MQRDVDGYIAGEVQDVHKIVNLCSDLLGIDRQRRMIGCADWYAQFRGDLRVCPLDRQCVTEL
jgi:hypothetical protein